MKVKGNNAGCESVSRHSAPGGQLKGAVARNSARATTAAAPPPAPLKMATICGMAVIGTRRAPSTPTTAPIGIPTARIQALPSPPDPSRKSVTKTHSTTRVIPAAAIWLPRRAVVGDERNFSPRMKVTAPTR